MVIRIKSWIYDIGYGIIHVSCLVGLFRFWVDIKQFIIFGNNFYEPYVYLVVMLDLSPWWLIFGWNWLYVNINLGIITWVPMHNYLSGAL
jgi:hypothetical protein